MVDTNENWRGIDVKREKSHDAMVVILTTGNPSIFTYIKDLMVFAATVGYSRKVRTPLHGETQGIILDTYHSDGKDGYVYLYGLLESQNGECLKIENLRETVKIYEEFCNAGLYEIKSWLDGNPADVTGIETILTKIYEEISMTEDAETTDPGGIEIEI